jgi:hypothetical protein
MGRHLQVPASGLASWIRVRGGDPSRSIKRTHRTIVSAAQIGARELSRTIDRRVKGMSICVLR